MDAERTEALAPYADVARRAAAGDCLPRRRLAVRCRALRRARRCARPPPWGQPRVRQPLRRRRPPRGRDRAGPGVGRRPRRAALGPPSREDRLRLRTRRDAEMVALARRTAAEAGVGNVEFLHGTIEDVPLDDASVDVVISNCVIVLSADKAAVFGEIAASSDPVAGWRSATSSATATTTATTRSDQCRLRSPRHQHRRLRHPAAAGRPRRRVDRAHRCARWRTEQRGHPRRAPSPMSALVRRSFAAPGADQRSARSPRKARSTPPVALPREVPLTAADVMANVSTLWATASDI